MGPDTAAPPATNHPPPATSENWLLLSALVLLGGASAIAYYLGFVKPYLLADYYLTPLLDLAKINRVTNSAANSWALAWVVVMGCYFLAFRLCPSAAGITRAYRWVALTLIGGWAAVFSVNLLFMYPVGAADLFDQIFRARLTTTYGLNPFTTLPRSIEGDPFVRFVAWGGDPSPYGPVWELLAAGTSALGSDSLWANLILFKLLVIVAYAGSALLTYLILKAWKPDWALRGTLFFAWNPLVLFEVAGNGHNDAFVMLFLLLGVYLFVTMRRWSVLPALALGALTKFVPALLVPIAIAAIWRDRAPRNAEGRPSIKGTLLTRGDVLQTLALGVGLSVGLAVFVYAPFWAGPDSVGALGRQSLFTASIPKVVLDWLTINQGVETRLAQGIVRLAALGLVGLAAVGLSLWVLLWKVRSAGSEEREGDADSLLAARHKLLTRTLRAFYEIIFIYLAFATLWFQPWYLLWLVALTAPLASYTYANRTLLFCIGAILHYFVWDFLWLWNRSPIREIQITDVLVVYTLPIFYTLYVGVREWKVMRNA